MNWYELDLIPRDVLFFRDARPMEGGLIGHGSQWPLPSVWHQALLSSFHEQWPTVEPWETVGPKDRHPKAGSGRFGMLSTCGLFPRKDDDLFVPTPADIGPNKCVAQLISAGGHSNLPSPLTRMPAFFAPPSKEKPGAWISFRDLCLYLQNDNAWVTTESSDLYRMEPRPGIAIQAATQTTETGKFYVAEYLRLRDEEGVKLTGFARCEMLKDGKAEDVIAKWMGTGRPAVRLGGQQGLAHLNGRREKKNDQFFPLNHTLSGDPAQIKWVLLSPALFNEGWRPNWVDAATGQVLLKQGDSSRKPGEDRLTWRKRVRDGQPIAAKLIAARIEKPQYVSGWNYVEGYDDREKSKGHKLGPKAAVALVPSGSVYYFKADSEEAGQQLIRALTGHPRSDSWGEKGFGIGVCGTWDEKKA